MHKDAGAGKTTGHTKIIDRQILDLRVTEQSVELFRRAGQPAELHLFSDADHFMFAETSTRVWSVLRDWLDRYFPARRDQPGA